LAAIGGQVSFESLISIINLTINLLLLSGVVTAFFQLRVMNRANKAQVLLMLIDEWRNPDNYNAIVYFHNIREQWKKQEMDFDKWDKLAKKWVDSYLPKTKHTSYPTKARMDDAWYMRRRASQFLEKMGFLLKLKYLTPSELFSVIPEAGRILAVLSPIEIELMKREESGSRIADWDRRAGKWAFYYLWNEYTKWYKKEGRNLFDLDMKGKGDRS
jgi:hypothetical protein